MPAVFTEIHPGVCGFTCQVSAASEDEQHVRFQIHSACEKIQGLAASLPADVDAYREIQLGHEGAIQLAVRTQLKGCCAGCVVPSGLFKSMQVAASLALPADCMIRIARA